MDLSIIVTSIVVMGIIIALGSIISFRMKVTTELKAGIMLIIINFSVPAIVLNSLFNTDVTQDLLHKVLIILIISISFHLIALLFTWGFAKFFHFQNLFAKKMSILAAFGNTGFIGIPLCASIFGPVGGLLAAIFNAGLDLIIFSVVIYMLQSDGRFQFKQLKALINPPFIAIVVGLILATAGFQPPQFVKLSIEMLSAIATPLAMIYVGMLIPPLFKKRRLPFYPAIWFPLGFRLLIIPILTIFIMSVIQPESLIRNLVIILSGMPTFMLVTVLFSRYTDDEETAVITTIYSTILSLLTIPVVSFIAAWWGRVG